MKGIPLMKNKEGRKCQVAANFTQEWTVHETKCFTGLEEAVSFPVHHHLWPAACPPICSTWLLPHSLLGLPSPPPVVLLKILWSCKRRQSLCCLCQFLPFPQSQFRGAIMHADGGWWNLVPIDLPSQLGLCFPSLMSKALSQASG